MEKKFVTLPTEEELTNRLLKNLEWRNRSLETSLLWQGYLGALLEWGLLEIEVFDRLRAHIPAVGLKEIYELAIGEPIPPDQEREIDEYCARQGKE